MASSVWGGTRNVPWTGHLDWSSVDGSTLQILGKVEDALISFNYLYVAGTDNLTTEGILGIDFLPAQQMYY